MFYVRVIDDRGRRPYGSIRVVVFAKGFFSGGKVGEEYADNDGVVAFNRELPFDGSIIVEGKTAYEGKIDNTMIVIQKDSNYSYHRVR